MMGNGNVIIFTDSDLLYLASYYIHTLKVRDGETGDVRYRAWQSTICQECGEVPTPTSFPHILDEDSFVLICCEGYHQINPNTIGQVNEQWMDWHEEMGGLESPAAEKLVEELGVECANCGMNRAQCNFNKVMNHGTVCCQDCTH